MDNKLFKNEFKSYIKDFSKKNGIDLDYGQIEEMCDYFFDEEDGIINHMLGSKIRDLDYAKRMSLIYPEVSFYEMIQNFDINLISKREPTMATFMIDNKDILNIESNIVEINDGVSGFTTEIKLNDKFLFKESFDDLGERSTIGSFKTVKEATSFLNEYVQDKQVTIIEKIQEKDLSIWLKEIVFDW